LGIEKDLKIFKVIEVVYSPMMFGYCRILMKAKSLDEFRRFRHLVRNVYTMNLKPDKMSGLMLSFPELWLKLQEELQAFSNFNYSTILWSLLMFELWYREFMM